MEHPEERYYKLNRLLLSAIGLWPYQSVRKAYMLRAVYLLSVVSSSFFQLSSALKYKINMEYVTDIIPAVAPTIGSLIHMYGYVKRKDKLKKLLDCMWKDWKLQKTDDETKIMHEYANTSKSLTFYFSLQTYVSMVAYFVWTCSPEILDIILPMNETRPRMQPFKTNFYIDEQKYFYFVRTHIFIAIFFLSIVLIAGCSLFMVFAQHICGMYELLGYRAERLFSFIENEGCDSYETEISRIKITAFVRLHCNIIKFVDIIEAFHKRSLLLDFLGIAVSLTFTLNQVLTISGDFERAIRSITLALLQLYYLFLFNYMGQRVTDMSSSVCYKM